MTIISHKDWGMKTMHYLDESTLAAIQKDKNITTIEISTGKLRINTILCIEMWIFNKLSNAIYDNKKSETIVFGDEYKKFISLMRNSEYKSVWQVQLNNTLKRLSTKFDNIVITNLPVSYNEKDSGASGAKLVWTNPIQ